MITLYKLDENSWFTGEVMEISDNAGYINGAGGWADIAPPSLAAGEYAVFLSDTWVLTTNPSPTPIVDEPAPPAEPTAPQEAPTVI